MAIGLNTTVTIPVITTAVTPTTVTTTVKVPGVAPNSDSLSTSVTTSGISTATVIPGVATFVTDVPFTALVPGILNSEPTLSIFTSRQSEVFTKLLDYKNIFKNSVEVQIVPDIVQLAVSTKKFETAVITSTNYITVKLSKSSSTSSSIDFNTISIGKNLVEILQTAFSNYFNISRVLQNIGNIIEAKYAKITKPLPNEIVRIADSQNIYRKPIKEFTELVTTNSNFKTFRIGLNPQNIASVPDIFARQINYIRDYLNTASIIPVNQITVLTYKQNTVRISDAGAFYKISDYTRNFTDVVLSSDDYYGLANIDDDQYANFSKRIAEQALGLQTIRYYYANKVLLEQPTITDTRTLVPGKFIIQSTLTNDINKFNIQKYLTAVPDAIISDYNTLIIKPEVQNSTNTADSLTRLLQYVRNYTSISVVTDLLNRLVNYTRNYNDVYATSEIAYYKPSLEKLDTVAFSEIAYYSSGRAITDSSTVTESKKYAASLKKLDTVLISSQNLALAQVQKRDSLLLTDLLTYVNTLSAITRLFTDSIRSTDSGTINNQDYFASSYVNPGYAGTNVNFGT